MDPSNHLSDIHQINYLTSELDALYHHASLKLGISDSVSVVLYTICDKGDGCLLSDVYKSSGVSKQTVNSAIRALERDGMLRLAAHTGRSKKILLTARGQDYLQATVARLAEAEARAFDRWPEAEIRAYIGLMEKYVESLRREIEEM